MNIRTLNMNKDFSRLCLHVPFTDTFFCPSSVLYSPRLMWFNGKICGTKQKTCMFRSVSFLIQCAPLTLSSHLSCQLLMNAIILNKDASQLFSSRTMNDFFVSFFFYCLGSELRCKSILVPFSVHNTNTHNLSVEIY